MCLQVKAREQTTPIQGNSSVDRADDIAAISDEWVLQEQVAVGFQDEQGKIRKSTYLLLQDGDFVDVEVKADIALRGNGKNATCHVYFSMERIIRLKAHEEYKVSVAYIDSISLTKDFLAQ